MVITVSEIQKRVKLTKKKYIYIRKQTKSKINLVEFGNRENPKKCLLKIFKVCLIACLLCMCCK